MARKTPCATPRRRGQVTPWDELKLVKCIQLLVYCFEFSRDVKVSVCVCDNLRSLQRPDSFFTHTFTQLNISLEVRIVLESGQRSNRFLMVNFVVMFQFYLFLPLCKPCLACCLPFLVAALFFLFAAASFALPAFVLLSFLIVLAGA